MNWSPLVQIAICWILSTTYSFKKFWPTIDEIKYHEILQSRIFLKYNYFHSRNFYQNIIHEFDTIWDHRKKELTLIKLIAFFWYQFINSGGGEFSCENIIILFLFSTISENWNGPGSWHPSSWKAMPYCSYILNIMANDDLAMQSGYQQLWHWPSYSRIQLSAILTQSNLSVAESESDIRITTHPIACPHGWAMGCLLWGFLGKLTML